MCRGSIITRDDFLNVLGDGRAHNHTWRLLIKYLQYCHGRSIYIRLFFLLRPTGSKATDDGLHFLASEGTGLRVELGLGRLVHYREGPGQ